MPFPCQTHLRAPHLLFEVCKLDHIEGNRVDIQIKSQQHPPTYQLKRRRWYWVFTGSSKPGCAMNGVIHCLSDGIWQRRYRLSLTCLPSWITSESGCEEFASWLRLWKQAKLKWLAHPYNIFHCIFICIGSNDWETAPYPLQFRFLYMKRCSWKALKVRARAP